MTIWLSLVEKKTWAKDLEPYLPIPTSYAWFPRVVETRKSHVKFVESKWRHTTVSNIPTKFDLNPLSRIRWFSYTKTIMTDGKHTHTHTRKLVFICVLLRCDRKQWGNHIFILVWKTSVICFYLHQINFDFKNTLPCKTFYIKRKGDIIVSHITIWKLPSFFIKWRCVYLQQ